MDTCEHCKNQILCVVKHKRDEFLTVLKYTMTPEGKQAVMESVKANCTKFKKVNLNL